MFDTELTKNTICPYCGYEDQDSWELSSNSGKTQCGNCYKEFHYERDIEVSYTTTKVEPINGQYYWVKHYSHSAWEVAMVYDHPDDGLMFDMTGNEHENYKNVSDWQTTPIVNPLG